MTLDSIDRESLYRAYQKQKERTLRATSTDELRRSLDYERRFVGLLGSTATDENELRYYRREFIRLDVLCIELKKAAQHTQTLANLTNEYA